MPRLSIVVWLPLACKSSSQKRAGAKDRLLKMSPRWGERAVWKPKSPKTGMVGRRFEVAGRKICTRLWREGRLEVKLVERWHDGSTFGRSGRQNLHHAVARERLGTKIVKDCGGVGTPFSGAPQNLHQAVAREPFGSQTR